MASGSYDGTVIVWNTESHEPISRIEAHPHELNRFGSLAFTPDERLLLSAGPDGREIKLWSWERMEIVDSLQVHFVELFTSVVDRKGHFVEGVTREDFTLMLAGVAEKSGRELQILEQRGAANDHPVRPTCLENEYLKCFVCRVE